MQPRAEIGRVHDGPEPHADAMFLLDQAGTKAANSK